MEKQTENRIFETRFQFLFYVNNNIICQRFIYVENYNEDCKKSLEIKEMYDNIFGTCNGDFGMLGIIPKHLKNKQSEYLWKQYFYNNPEINSEENKDERDKESNFKFEVRVDNEPIIVGVFDGRYIKPKHIDIKEIIPDVTRQIKYYLSLNEYTEA